MEIEENNYQKILFELITLQNWKAVEDILNKYKIDPDIRDSAGNYLIHLFIYYNQIHLLKLLLKLEPRLDILDPDGKQICYLPIRYNQLEILKLLLEYNKINYGIDITNFRDSNQLSPLFYSVKFNSELCTKLLLDNGARLDVTDKNKNTPLHVACLYGKEELVKVLSSYYPEMKLYINLNKQTPLHSSILSSNIKITKLILQDENKSNLVLAQDDNDRTPLMYAIEFQNIKCMEELLDIDLITKNILMELQDIEGNTHYHLAIKFKINLDLFIVPTYNSSQKINVDGNTILHLLLMNDLDNYFPDILKTSSLLIQNNENSTPLHLLMPIKWLKYKDILETKKLAIYLKNKSGITPYSMINSVNKELFLKIVTKSYYNLLIKNPDAEYVTQWENECAHKKRNINQCEKEIIDNINKNISYPIKKKNYCINITSKMVSNLSYLGITIDIIGGLMELDGSNTVTSLLLNDIVHNPNLSTFYQNNRIIRNDLLNFEIIWSYQTIFFPIGLDILFKQFLKDTLKKSRYFVVPIGIELSQGSHANILIYDKKYNELERFEPDGSKSPNGFYYFPDELDTYIYQYFSKLTNLDKMEYQKPIDSIPRISFQRYENLESNNKTDRGYCGTWSAWYAFQRIRTGIKMNKLIPKLLQKIRGSNLMFKQIVRNYASIMSNNRDILFNKINITSDDWFNYLTNEQLVKLGSLIKHKHQS